MNDFQRWVQQMPHVYTYCGEYDSRPIGFPAGVVVRRWEAECLHEVGTILHAAWKVDNRR